MRARAILTASRLVAGVASSAALLFCGCAIPDANISTGPAAVVSGTPLSGELPQILSASSSPYRVTGDLIVPAGASTTIEKGVELRFDGLYKLLVLGHLEAIGTAQENIVFTSGQGSLGSGDFGQWRAIIFDTGADTSVLAYCQVKFGAVWDTTVRYPDSTGLWANGAILCWNSSPTIRNCNILTNGYHGIYAVGSQSRPHILNNIIYENDGDGIRCEPMPGQAAKAEPDIWYNDVKENNARQFADTPDSVGVWSRVNDNGDPCDFQFNIGLDPLFEGFELQNYLLHSCSPCIVAGQGGLNIGSIPYDIGNTELRGDIGDSVLTAGIWTVTCDAFVNHGDSLVIETGALLLFKGIYKMRISGLLQAEGATFQADSLANPSGEWLGLLLDEQSDPASYVRHCRFVGAAAPLSDDPFAGAITIQGVAPDVSYNTFEDCKYAAISCQHHAQPTLGYNVISGFGPAAIVCLDNSHPSIHHNKIHSGLGYGIYCSFFSSPLIETNLIYDGQAIGLKFENQSSPIVRYNTIAQNAYAGILCLFEADPDINHNIVAFNGTPITWADTTYGNALTVEGSSLPQLSHNDLYQAEGSVYNSGFSPLPDSTNINEDPLFVNAAADSFQLSLNSPAMIAGEDSSQIGAYGLGPW